MKRKASRPLTPANLTGAPDDTATALPIRPRPRPGAQGQAQRPRWRNFVAARLASVLKIKTKTRRKSSGLMDSSDMLLVLVHVRVRRRDRGGTHQLPAVLMPAYGVSVVLARLGTGMIAQPGHQHRGLRPVRALTIVRWPRGRARSSANLIRYLLDPGDARLGYVLGFRVPDERAVRSHGLPGPDGVSLREVLASALIACW